MTYLLKNQCMWPEDKAFLRLTHYTRDINDTYTFKETNNLVIFKRYDENDRPVVQFEDGTLRTLENTKDLEKVFD